MTSILPSVFGANMKIDLNLRSKMYHFDDLRQSTEKYSTPKATIRSIETLISLNILSKLKLCLQHLKAMTLLPHPLLV